VAGKNIISAYFFPDSFSTYDLIESIGKSKVNTVHLLKPSSGRWLATSVVNDTIVGDAFDIPRVAVLMLDMENNVAEWIP
jgi:hypothetical protein